METYRHWGPGDVFWRGTKTVEKADFSPQGEGWCIHEVCLPELTGVLGASPLTQGSQPRQEEAESLGPKAIAQTPG